MADEIKTEGTSRGGFGPILTLAFLSLAIILVGYFLLGTVVPAGYLGVRQIRFGPGQGFSNQGLAPGYHWNIPFYSTIHLVPRTIQMINFTRSSDSGKYSNFGALEIFSSDRAKLEVDVSVLYRVFESESKKAGESHGGPDALLTRGTTQTSWENEVRQRVEDQLKRNLGQLRTASFYDPKEREPRLEEALRIANEVIAPIGIKIEAILLRRFTYEEDRIDNAIFQKNLQEQEEQKNLAQSRFVAVEGTVRKIEAELTAQNETLRVQGQKVAQVIRSEGDLYETQKKAQADLMVAKARAEVGRLKAEALAKSTGAEAYVGAELAPVLSSLKGGVISGINPYDLDQWLKRLGVGGGSK